MDERVTYNDCESRYIDQGYDLSRPAEGCASAIVIFPLPPAFFE